jgi:hypothetical protein
MSLIYLINQSIISNQLYLINQSIISNQLYLSCTNLSSSTLPIPTISCVLIIIKILSHTLFNINKMLTQSLLYFDSLYTTMSLINSMIQSGNISKETLER